MRGLRLIGCLVFPGCMTAAVPPAAYPVMRPEPQLEWLQPLNNADLEGRQRVVATARQLLTRSEYRIGDYVFAADQIGFVRAAFWAAGKELINNNIAKDTQLSDMTLLFRSVAAN